MFKRHVETESGGHAFDVSSGFDHPFLIDTEISYKWRAYRDARDVLQLDRWDSWRRNPGKILNAVKSACLPRVTSNLLEHRWGPEQGPMSPLYKVGSSEVPAFEHQLFDFFAGGPFERPAFGDRFDAFASFLRDHRLSCQWTFLSYLSFVAEPRLYFPFLPTRWDHLLRFYGNDARVSGQVSWERYEYVLDLAEVLRERLSHYGRPNAVEIQSYMFVVAYLLPQVESDDDTGDELDYSEELSKRASAAEERERRGLAGEIHVYELERRRLVQAGYPRLSARVRLVSATQPNAGYDVLSFHEDGNPRHIEVKSTSRRPESDTGFFLSENERRIAVEDDAWTVVRVWDVLSAPNALDLGNVVRGESSSWKLVPSSWWVEPREG